MSGNWLTELTGARKPIIGMVHLPALPGTPLYDTWRRNATSARLDRP